MASGDFCGNCTDALCLPALECLPNKHVQMTAYSVRFAPPFNLDSTQPLGSTHAVLVIGGLVG